MSHMDIRSAARPDPDQVMVDIADYVVDYNIQSPEAFATARYMQQGFEARLRLRGSVAALVAQALCAQAADAVAGERVRHQAAFTQFDHRHVMGLAISCAWVEGE